MGSRQLIENKDLIEESLARARGMTQLAKDTGLSRESLYRSLSGERAPNSDTLFKVIKAMGLKLSVVPAA